MNEDSVTPMTPLVCHDEHTLQTYQRALNEYLEESRM